MGRVAVLSFHTSPLAQPGQGDGGGMNVYVRELAGALAQAGVETDVFTRASSPSEPPIQTVEPGLRVHHVPAGPLTEVPKEQLPAHLDEFTAGVRCALLENRPGAIHANYWLSGVVGHRLKHELELPLVSTFHTLDRVKAEADLHEPGGRAEAEVEIIGCSDVISVSCDDEARQLQRLYGADPDRIEIVAPGVDHAFFSPGDRAGARAALGLDDRPVLLFVGRIQPLKGLDLAVASLAALTEHSDARLVVVGGPSGTDGPAALAAARAQVRELGLEGRVRFEDPKPHHLLSTYYRAADVVVVPSHSESFGLVALEAAACGIPVVAAAVGGLTQIVRHGETGLLVDERDADVFARRIAAVLDEPRWAAEMGAAAAGVAAGYRWSIAAGRLRRLYADLATRSPAPCAAVS